MTMTTYLPLYTKGKSNNWAADPSCVFAPGLNKDGATFRSDDKYGHLCTKSGALWTPTGFYSDGVDDTVIAPYSSAFDFTTQYFTCCMWIYDLFAAQNANKFMFGFGSYAVGGWDFFANAGRYWFKTYESGSQKQSISNTGVCDLYKWHFLCATRTSKGVIYKDGINITASSDTLYDPTSLPTRSLYVGSYSPSPIYSWYGYWALPKIFNRALSQGEVCSIYDSEKSLFI